MNPVMSPRIYTFGTLKDLSDLGDITPLCQFIEAEGVSLILDSEDARAVGLRGALDYKMITLSVYSDLEAIGFIATIAQRLAAALIPCNAVSAFFHDHVFVPKDLSEAAMYELHRLMAESVMP